jgi:transposase
VSGVLPMITLCYEVGYDAFWLTRFLTARGIECLVIDPGSLQVNRRGRPDKTDRVDVKVLLRTLIAWCRGERQVAAIERETRRPHPARRPSASAISYYNLKASGQRSQPYFRGKSITANSATGGRIRKCGTAWAPLSVSTWAHRLTRESWKPEGRYGPRPGSRQPASAISTVSMSEL